MRWPCFTLGFVHHRASPLKKAPAMYKPPKPSGATLMHALIKALVANPKSPENERHVEFLSHLELPPVHSAPIRTSVACSAGPCDSHDDAARQHAPHDAVGVFCPHVATDGPRIGDAEAIAGVDCREGCGTAVTREATSASARKRRHREVRPEHREATGAPVTDNVAASVWRDRNGER